MMSSKQTQEKNSTTLKISSSIYTVSIKFCAILRNEVVIFFMLDPVTIGAITIFLKVLINYSLRLMFVIQVPYSSSPPPPYDYVIPAILKLPVLYAKV